VLGLVSRVADTHMPGNAIDVAAAIEMLEFHLPDPSEHHFLAAFVAALTRADLWQAADILANAMVDWKQGGRMRPWDLRPQILLPSIRRLIRDIVQSGLPSGPLRLRVPESVQRHQRQQLFLRDIMASSESVAAPEYFEESREH